jgi:hypothetical protein
VAFYCRVLHVNITAAPRRISGLKGNIFFNHFEIQSTFIYLYSKAKKNKIVMVAQNKRLIGILLAIALLLFIPLIAMQFTTEVDWSPFDFAIMGTLLLGTGLLCELVLRNVKTIQNRLLICGTLLIVFFLIWAELAVGIFGTPFAGS